jgi:hypothetical protein
MPDKHTHTPAGIVSGGFVTLFDPRQMRGEDRFWYVSGGTFGGGIGGRVPDVLEPAYSPTHRQFFHAIVPFLGIGPMAYKGIEAVVAYLIEKAEAIPLIVRADGTVTSPFKRMLLFFTAGVFKGFPPGYASHLFLDFCTPACLPLFGKFDAECPPAPRRKRAVRRPRRKSQRRHLMVAVTA